MYNNNEIVLVIQFAENMDINTAKIDTAEILEAQAKPSEVITTKQTSAPDSNLLETVSPIKSFDLSTYHHDFTSYTSHTPHSSAVLGRTHNANSNMAMSSYSSAFWDGVDFIRSHLSANLVSYCIPQRVLVMDTIPVTPHGKVDRKALFESVVNRQIQTKNSISRSLRVSVVSKPQVQMVLKMQCQVNIV